MSKLFRLKTSRIEKDFSNVSVYIDKQKNNLLSLYCLYTEQTKSAIVRGLIDNWENELDVSEEEMLNRLADRAANNWKGRWAYSDNWDKSFDEFMTDVENTLHSKGLGRTQIENIKTQVKNKIDGTKDKEDR